MNTQPVDFDLGPSDEPISPLPADQPITNPIDLNSNQNNAEDESESDPWGDDEMATDFDPIQTR